MNPSEKLREKNVIMKDIGGITCQHYLHEEVAKVTAFLLCDAPNCLNGQIFVCNEGKTINARWK